MSLFIVLLAVAGGLCIADVLHKVPSWTWGFVIIVALLVKFWGV